ncbi:MAG: carboxylating nicotinate-nucleotide diphosphorylase, partial [Candidatus Kariarchaeaceae archaeon]
IIMLDNMEPETIQLIHEALVDKNLRKNIILEISGGINPANLKDYASLPIDIISMGSLTHSVIALDLGLDF